MIINEGYIRNIVRNTINEVINSALILEANISDPYIEKYKDKIKKRIGNLLNSGDESMKKIVDSLGYTSDYDIKTIKDAKRRLFVNNNISNEVTNDILEIAEILSKYTDNGGNVYIKRNEVYGIKQDPNRRYLEDDYSEEDVRNILLMKDFIDRMGLTILYDKTAKLGSRTYGLTNKGGLNTSNFDLNNITDSDAKNFIGDKLMIEDEARWLIKQMILTNYLNAKYGMKLEIPKISFSNGNKKIPTTTLIINFDSAVGCPAWNECIVKHACYARNTEKAKPTVYKANKNKTMAWLATKNDPQMMELLLNMVKAYCFNYGKVADEIIKKGLVKIKNKNKLVDKLIETNLTDPLFTPEIIEILKQYRRIHHIRLNENGDFIGQWLVDAWDEYAKELLICDIYVSAYTCRHLNYEGIKAIILNTSFSTKNENIARNFIAVPENIYEALDETYGGNNNSLVLTNGNVIPSLQPLFSVIHLEDGSSAIGNPNGSYYYKCPCGRNIDGDKINCYQCNLCYQPNQFEKPSIVFVKAHGSNADMLKRNTIEGFGVSRNYFANIASMDGKNKMAEGVIKEETETISNAQIRIAKNTGIKSVTKNAVSSLYEHLGLK